MDAASPAMAETAFDEIDRARAAFVEAIRLGDAAAVAALYNEDARLVAPAVGRVRGREDVARFWRAGVDSGICDVELEPDDVEVMPEVAWEVGRYSLCLAVETGERITDLGRYLLVYALEAGRWQRAAEMFRPDSTPSI